MSVLKFATAVESSKYKARLCSVGCKAAKDA